MRALSVALAEAGWQVRLAAGSLGGPDAATNATSFFSGVDVSAVDYSPALLLADPLAAPVPFQPSYGTGPGALTVSSRRSMTPPMSGWWRPGPTPWAARVLPRLIFYICTI